ncbi:chorismate mutase [Methylocapsa acidiphila]|uniref:chorismate mutase n=1 Tax=Methylocapsa acidiphila TaxID=133552 RepID=UPI000400A31F|nr:chorismate mutase [Methylocapsa acidiphila]
MPQPSCQETLADLRVEIDRIDADLHKLLMERGEIIHRLIEAKARQGGGSAFRPGREADMMRTLASRHEGLLPLDTVESIWRIIISTFTYVQANYSVHADISAGDAAMRDCCRFHFGFTVPYVVHQGASAVIDAVAKSNGDLGLAPVKGGAASGPWWRGLIGPGAPKVIARLPFVERPDHPAGTPLFVIAQPLAEAAARDVVVYSIALERWLDEGPTRLAALGAEILDSAADGFGLSLMVAASGAVGPEQLREALIQAGAVEPRIAEIGSHAARFDFSSAQRPETQDEAA